MHLVLRRLWHAKFGHSLEDLAVAIAQADSSRLPTRYRLMGFQCRCGRFVKFPA